MNIVLSFALLLTRLFLYGGLALIVWQMLTGKIKLHGLLADKERGLPMSPARVQALMSTVGVAFYLLLAAQANARDGKHEMPTVPSEALLLIGGSNMLYLGIKAAGKSNTPTTKTLL